MKGLGPATALQHLCRNCQAFNIEHTTGVLPPRRTACHREMKTETATRRSIRALRKISAGRNNRLLVRTLPGGQMLDSVFEKPLSSAQTPSQHSALNLDVADISSGFSWIPDGLLRGCASKSENICIAGQRRRSHVRRERRKVRKTANAWGRMAQLEDGPDARAYRMNGRGTRVGVLTDRRDRCRGYWWQVMTCIANRNAALVPSRYSRVASRAISIPLAGRDGPTQNHG